MCANTSFKSVPTQNVEANVAWSEKSCLTPAVKRNVGFIFFEGLIFDRNYVNLTDISRIVGLNFHLKSDPSISPQSSCLLK